VDADTYFVTALKKGSKRWLSALGKDIMLTDVPKANLPSLDHGELKTVLGWTDTFRICRVATAMGDTT